MICESSDCSLLTKSACVTVSHILLNRPNVLTVEIYSCDHFTSNASSISPNSNIKA